MTDRHSKTLWRPKDRFRPDVTALTPFKTPGWEPEKKSNVLEWPNDLWVDPKQAETKRPDTTSPTSSSHLIRVHSPQSPSSSPPAQFSPREHLVSPKPEDHTTPKQQTIIRPQDIDTQLTPGLAALVQETSPLAPYKIQHSAKRRAWQMLSNMR